MADRELGLLKTKRSKFLLFTLVTSGCSYLGLKYIRDYQPKTYQSLVWDSVHKSIYPFLLTMTVILSLIYLQTSTFMQALFLKAGRFQLLPRFPEETILDPELNVKKYSPYYIATCCDKIRLHIQQPSGLGTRF